MSDSISRDAVSSWLKQYGQDVLHGKYKFSLMYIWKNLMDLPSVQPEIIRCKDCIHRGEKPIADGRYWCELHDTFMYYCSDAEVRAGEETDIS